MKKKHKKDFFRFKGLPRKIPVYFSSSLETLESAWNNLPHDMTAEERLIFIEIAEKVVKVYHKIKDSNQNQENEKN